ncbi:LOW QUALITY PROTEIN: zinc finger protein 410 [Gadus macrocephalus]|uniref:LOW QUALITY PROTEIN: zinc finger protein 410 n=1 Tax=Gadus macrocephalus TaxID=80720 RepID=UPI0028CBB1A4|nr:LOW QUALITY PROTEIN: zinc finger protein 410 [Gadus macrocephalus]
MLSDELDSKPELLVQFVQNASIPLVQGLEDSESKHCLSLLAPTEVSLCGPLELTDGRLSHEPVRSPTLSRLRPRRGRVPGVHSPLGVRSHVSQSPPPILHELQQSDTPSYVLLNLAKGLSASSEPLIFSADGAGEEDDEGGVVGDYGIDGSAPWYLRVQELAHDSLIAATRAQLARDAKASQEARAADVFHSKDLLALISSAVFYRHTLSHVVFYRGWCQVPMVPPPQPPPHHFLQRAILGSPPPPERFLEMAILGSHPLPGRFLESLILGSHPTLLLIVF